MTKRNYEAEARANGWVTEKEKYPQLSVYEGVVHPDGWWAPDWQSACKGFGDHAVRLRPRKGDTHYRART